MGMDRHCVRCVAAVILHCLLAVFAARAYAEPAPQLEQPESPGKAAWRVAGAAMVHGPKDVALKDQAHLALPEGFAFIPQKEAATLMRTMGNQTGEGFIGLIMSDHDDANWMVSVDFNDAGYVKDDDAKNWDAKALLKSLTDGTEAGNEERKEQGIPAIKLTRWIEPPAYDGVAHQLVWSAEVKLRDSPDPDPAINYNTYVLGREGYIEMNLVTSESTIEQDKGVARQLLSKVTFVPGKGYSDFKSSTDKVAAYGLAALVAGVAAKKLGLIALAGAFVLKFAKVIAIAVAASGGGLWRWMKARAGKNTETPS